MAPFTVLLTFSFAHDLSLIRTPHKCSEKTSRPLRQSVANVKHKNLLCLWNSHFPSGLLRHAWRSPLPKMAVKVNLVLTCVWNKRTMQSSQWKLMYLSKPVCKKLSGVPIKWIMRSDRVKLTSLTKNNIYRRSQNKAARQHEALLKSLTMKVDFFSFLFFSNRIAAFPLGSSKLESSIWISKASRKPQIRTK